MANTARIKTCASMPCQNLGVPASMGSPVSSDSTNGKAMKPMTVMKKAELRLMKVMSYANTACVLRDTYSVRNIITQYV